MRVHELFDLSGRAAIVTGGARGLGRQAAQALAEAGADVAICDLLEAEGEKTRQELQALHSKSLFRRVDVSHPAEVETFVQVVLDHFGKIDILVNNAGMRTGGLSLEETDEESWRDMMETNLSSVFYFGRAVANHMIARGQGGVIINMASMNAFIIGNLFPRHNVPYCVAKAGVAQLTKGMASDWAQYNIRVNAIAPGYMKTAMTEPTRQYPTIMERLIDNTPMKRYGEEEEIKGTVVYLASQASSFMTGSVIVIDGGTTIW